MIRWKPYGGDWGRPTRSFRPAFAFLPHFCEDTGMIVWLGWLWKRVSVSPFGYHFATTWTEKEPPW